MALFLHLPTLEFARGILDGSIAQDVYHILEELGIEQPGLGDVANAFAALQGDAAQADTLLSELRRDFTQLFSHPLRPSVSIYETLLLADPDAPRSKRPLLFTSPAALDAARCYKKAGLAPAATVNEPEDHFATQFEFMSYLYRRQLSLLGGDAQALEQNSESLREFSLLHLHKWVEPFFVAVARKAQSPSYQAFAHLGSHCAKA
ncbi:MAG: molecular chaperone TorD family protein [Coriobacteriales bacterium]|nr:molecular chaperone TorD family protein [Coriobacteriales bacterium]